ncbi:hypothetical protein GH714_015846 [Hevea brasiliensis]|uniref:Cytochrome P450 n=1 Tax=Hevea brasiliensis TaxID=3981 RepID=A0A6A6N4C0_HEVBR|nr:hypothetical protein GH714_015846 [Hevea brasiliensis]
MTELLGPRQVERFHSIRGEELQRFIQKIVEKDRENENVNLEKGLMKLTNNIVCRIAMSTSCSEEEDEAERCKELVEGSIELTGKMVIVYLLGPLKKVGRWVFMKELKDISRRIDELLEKILKEHEERAKKDGGSLPVRNTYFSRWHALDYGNAHQPSKLVKETLRLYPLGPVISRASREDSKIGGFDIPKETVVLINLYSMMRDPEIWDNPDEFKLERLLVSHKETDKENHSLGYVPFGGGRRMCPGSHLALTISHITIASMVQCFDWKVSGGDGDGGKVNIEAKSSMIMCLAHPIVCLPEVHYNPFVA